MTDHEWRQGWGRLTLAFPADATEAMATARARVYREQLDPLAFAAWRYAVRQALQRCRYFPTIAELLELAADAPEERPALPQPRRTDQDKQAAREATRKGLDLIRQHLADPSTPLPEWPEDTKR